MFGARAKGVVFLSEKLPAYLELSVDALLSAACVVRESRTYGTCLTRRVYTSSGAAEQHLEVAAFCRVKHMSHVLLSMLSRLCLASGALQTRTHAPETTTRCS